MLRWSPGWNQSRRPPPPYGCRRGAAAWSLHAVSDDPEDLGGDLVALAPVDARVPVEGLDGVQHVRHRVDHGVLADPVPRGFLRGAHEVGLIDGENGGELARDVGVDTASGGCSLLGEAVGEGRLGDAPRTEE